MSSVTMVARRAAVVGRRPGLLFGTLAFVLALEITEPPGPGLDTDAAAYLGAAASLVQRGELVVPRASWWTADSTVPLAHFPPGYAVAIAIPAWAGMEPIQSARLVSAISAFVTLATLVSLVADATTPLVGLMFGAALIVLPAMHEVHVSVLSEPLYLAVNSLLLAVMVRRPERTGVAGTLAAMALLVRYVGVSLVGAVALWAVWPRASGRIRLRRLAWALAPPLVAGGLWVLRTSRVATTEPIRQIALYGGLSDSLRDGIRTIAAWLVPDPWHWTSPVPHRVRIATLVAALLAVVLAAGARSLRRARQSSPAHEGALAAETELAWRSIAASVLLIACYLVVLVTSRLVADPDIPFDQRLLSPVFVLGTMLTCITAFHWWIAADSRLRKIGLITAGLAWWCAAFLVTRGAVRRVRSEGSDYDRARWSRSELIAWARTADGRHSLFTNRQPAVYFHLHRPARDVPTIEEASRLQEFADRVRALDGRVLMFRAPTAAYVTIDALKRTPGLRPIFESASGVVFAPVTGPPMPSREDR